LGSVESVRDDAYFVIVGDGPERQRLEYYRDQLGVGNRVRFVGHQDGASRWIQAFDLLLEWESVRRAIQRNPGSNAGWGSL
jgi:phosphatidylinositol alpha-1,6-mannosyltransferase